MCGIIASFNIKDNAKVNEEIINQYEDQFDRGQRGFGIITINKTGKFEIHRSTEPAKMMFDLHNNPSSMIIMHHRLPTSSRNKLQQTHPITVDNGSLKYKYLFIHNGCVMNSDILKKEHEELGFVYSTSVQRTETNSEYNDSESLAIEFARFVEKQKNKIDVSNYLAFICLQIDRTTDKVKRIYFGKNMGGSLNLAMDRKRIFLSSEGKGHAVDEEFIYHFDLKEFKLNKMKSKYTERQTTDYNYGNYYGESRTIWSSKDDKETKLISLNSDIPNIGFNIDDKEWKEEITRWDKEIIEEEISSEFESLLEDISDEIEEIRDKCLDIDDVFMVDPMDECKRIIEALKTSIEKCQEIQIKYIQKESSASEKSLTDNKTECKI